MTGAYMGVTIKVAVVVVVVMMVHDNGDINIKNGGNGLTVVDGIKKKPKENTSLLLGGDFGPLRVGSVRVSIHKC